MRVGHWLTLGEEQIFTKDSGLHSNNHVMSVPTSANQRAAGLRLSWSPHFPTSGSRSCTQQDHLKVASAIWWLGRQKGSFHSA